MSEFRAYPNLLSRQEKDAMIQAAERLWKELQENNLGGYSDGNRPFYIYHTFKEIIERFGNRDVGLGWSKDALEAHKDHPPQPNPIKQEKE